MEFAFIVAALLCLALWWLWPRRPVERWDPVHDRYGREVYVYAFASVDRRTHEVTHVKFGHSAQADGVRERQIEDADQEGQVPRTHMVRALARGHGGGRREITIHRRCANDRYPRSEWFAVTPTTVLEVARMERITALGNAFLTGHKRRNRWWRRWLLR